MDSATTIGRGRYSVLGEIGRGATGVVYRAHDRVHDREIALKILRPRPDASPSSLGAEFRLLASHSHPGLVQVFDYGITEAGSPYFTMECLAPEGFAAFCERERASGPLVSSDAFLTVVTSLLEAVDYLHSRGHLHSDLKPSNILIVQTDDGSPAVKLIDFGLATNSDGRSHSGAAGLDPGGAADPARDDLGSSLAGTVDYMAPELLRGSEASTQSDLYSIGCILFEALCGSVPFPATTAGAAISLHLKTPAPPLEAEHGVFRKVVGQLLAKDPRERPSSAQTVIERLGLERYIAAARPFPPFGSALVGREPLMRRVDELADADANAKTCALLLRGPTGIGKSRLLRQIEIRRQLRGERAGLTTCHTLSTPGDLVRNLLSHWRTFTAAAGEPDSSTSSPTHPAPDAPPVAPGRTRSAFDDAEAIVAQITGQITGRSEDATAVEAWFDRLLEGLKGVVADVTRAGPLLFCIDDVHEADALSRRALTALIRWLASRSEAERATGPEGSEGSEGSARLVFVLGCRDETGPERAAASELETAAAFSALESIHLSGVSTSDMRHYLTQVLRLRQLPESFVERVAEATGGNLLYVDEYIKSMVRSGQLARRGTEWQLSHHEMDALRVPESVSETLERRTAHFDAETTELVQCLAILETPQSPERVASLRHSAGDARDRSAIARASERILRELAAEHFLERTGSEYRFAHSAARKTVYEKTPETRRRQLHGLIAADLLHLSQEERARRVPELAHHLYGAGELGAALPHLMQSAGRALQVGSYRDAARDARRAIEAADAAGDPRARFAALMIDQEAAGHLGDRSRQRESLERLRELASELGDADLTRQSGLKESLYLESIGEKREALERLGSALSELGGDPRQTAPILPRSALLHFYLSEFSQGFEKLEQALETARQSDDRSLEAEALQLIGLGHYFQGAYNDAKTAMERALAVRRELDEAHQVGALESNLGLIHLDRGDLDAAEERFTASLGAFRAIGLRRGEAINLLNLGLVYLELGRYELALTVVGRSLRLRRELGDRRGEGADLGNLGEVWLRLGRVERARPLIEEAIARARETENRASESANVCRLGQIELKQGRSDAGLKHLNSSLELAQRTGVPAQQISCLLALCDAHLQADEPRRAIELAEEATELAAKVNMGLKRLEGQTALAAAYRQAGELERAVSISRAAVETLESGAPATALAPRLWWELYASCAADVDHAEKPRRQDDEQELALRRSYTALRKLADAFEDAELRRQFLDGVPLHRTIDAEHAAMQSQIRKEASLRERSFYQIAASLHSFDSLNPLLDHLLALAIETTHAEKGLILLKSPSGDFTTKAARGMERQSVQDAFEICRSVIADVARGRGPVLATDAGNDERFRARESIISFRIRTLMCVPMSLRDEIIGAVYVDSRGALSFDEDDLEYLVSFAQLAAIAVDNARLLDGLRSENQHLRREVEGKYRVQNLIGDSMAMQNLLKLVDKIARTDASVLISGETGTGKELVARGIHYGSSRRSAPFVAVDCGALPDSLLESELFGHVKGSFSGALVDRRGLLEEADGGTLFLDEISNTSLDLQAKLLRFLQEGELRPVGANKIRRANVRVLAASNVDLRAAVEAGSFREDLFYRLNVINVELPPLRDRSEDVPLLVHHFLHQSRERLGHAVEGFTDEALRFLAAARWNGNVRELQNVIERAVILSEAPQIDRRFLELLMTPTGRARAPGAADAGAARVDGAPTGDQPSDQRESVDVTEEDDRQAAFPPSSSQEAVTLEEFDRRHLAAERHYLQQLVESTNGNLSAAARMGGVRNRNTLISRLKKHGLFKPRQS